MRLSQYIVGVIAALTFFVFYHFAGAVQQAWAELSEEKQGSVLAEVTASWIDGQVALSLERSIVQVALAHQPEGRAPFITMIAAQRRAVDDHFNGALAARTPNENRKEHFEAFEKEGRAVITEIDRTRRLLDRELQTAPAGDPAGGRLVKNLIRLIDDTAIVREHLDVASHLLSNKSVALKRLQRLAWETREAAGRVRTHYAVATLTMEPIPADTRAYVVEESYVASRAWRAAMAVASTIELPPALTEAIAKAEEVYFTRHAATLASLDAAFAQARGAGQPDTSATATLPLSFDAFFDESAAALASLQQVATVAGDEVARYWEGRRDNADQKLLINSVLALGAVFFTIAMAILIRRHVVNPVTDATRLISQVAMGDLDASITRRKSELSEIAALHDALERFRLGLRQARKAEESANTDHLTGLHNRRHLQDLIAQNEGLNLQSGDNFVFIDLDEFKPINDSFGHAAGDVVLREIAKRIRSFGDNCDEVWRLGGDEFGLLWRGMESEDAIRHRADMLLEDIARPINYDNHDLLVGASIGVSIKDGDVLRAEDLLSRADSAMFIAKQRPVQKIEIYSARTASRRFGLDNRREITRALETGAFVPVFQPQVELATRRLIGFEALARWRRRDGSLATPGEFFDQIDYFQLKGAFDLEIAKKTLAVMHRAKTEIGQIPSVSINISEEALASHETRRAYLALFEEYADCVSYLTIEVTENALIDRSANAIRSALSTFARAGVRLSMDDFGTGYGSFRHLQEYRFDEIKIDRSFVHQIGSEHSADIIINGFLSIANGLKARVVAEGIETNQQHQRLMAMGCAFGQGFLFGRPMPEADALSILRDTREAQTRAQLEATGAA